MDPRAEELRSEIRAANQAELAIITAAQTAKRALSTEEKTTADGHAARAVELQGQLDVHLRGEALRLKIGDDKAKAPESQRGQGQEDDAEGRTSIHVVNPKEEAGDALGAVVSARMRFGFDQARSIDWAKKAYGERSPQARAMQASNFTAGGALIGENFVGAELIELLRAQAKFRKAGARQIPLVGGTATLPKITGGSTSSWTTEGGNIAASEVSTGSIKMAEKKLTSLVPVSNDLMRTPSLAIDRLLRDDMVASSANAEDLAIFRGDGLDGSPKGIYYWVGAAGRTNSAGATLANIRTDIRTAKKYLGNNNAPMVRRAWFMHSQAQDFIGTEIVDANSNLVWPTMANGEGALWNGGIVYPDNNIPINLTAGVPDPGVGTKSEVYFVEMSECFIGDSFALEIEVFANATYLAASGSLRSGVSSDESVVRLIRRMDFAMRHVESAHVTEEITWGN